MEIHSEKIKGLREEKLWSQDELAIAAGLSLRTVQRAEREGVASLQSLKAIASALCVDSATLRAARSAVTPDVDESEVDSGIADVAAAPIAAEAVGEVTTPKEKTWFAIYRGWIAASLLVAIGIAIVVWAVREDGTDLRELEDLSVVGRPEDMPFHERILGHWESSSSGSITTLDLDEKKRLEIGGDTLIKAKYQLLDNAVSYRVEGRVIAARIVFDSPTEMVWTTDDTGAVMHYTRNKIVMPSRREVYASMKGTWYGLGAIQTLVVEPEKMRMTMADGTAIESPYTIDGLRLSLQHGSELHYAVAFGAFGRMTWTKVFTAEGYSFVREKP